MSLSDELLADSKESSYRVEWDGSSGTIETGTVGEEFNPSDLNGVLAHCGLNPEVFRITGHVGMSMWDQWARNHDTGEMERRRLYAHKFRYEQRAWSVDLPALYAEVAKAKTRSLKPKVADSTVVVCWADVQMGKVDHLGGLRELLERLDEKREALDIYLRKAQFDRIVVADCGDIIEGFGNFPAQARTNALSLMDQVDVAATEFWKAIRLCERHAPVDVLSVPSNHCSWRREGKHLMGKTTDDWGLHISKRLERQNEEIGLRLAFHRPQEWCETLQFDIRGTRLGLAHGHQVNNPDQVKNWWAKMTHSGVLDCQVLLTGHFHFASLRPVGKDAATGRSRWHIQAPTLDNGSSWVRNKYGEDGDPALCVFQVNDEGFDLQSYRLL